MVFLGYEVFERMAFYGISANLVIYLTKKLHEGTVASSNSVTNWTGTAWILPILGAYIADAHLGRFWTFIIASGIYVAVKFKLGIIHFGVSFSKQYAIDGRESDSKNSEISAHSGKISEYY